MYLRSFSATLGIKRRIGPDHWIAIEGMGTVAVEEEDGASTDPAQVRREALDQARLSIREQLAALIVEQEQDTKLWYDLERTIRENGRAQARAEQAKRATAAQDTTANHDAGHATAPAATTTPPTTPDEAERRFFARYGPIICGDDWRAVQSYLDTRIPKPTTVEGWISAAQAVRDAHNLRATEATPPAQATEDAPAQPAAATPPASTRRATRSGRT